MSVMRSLLMSQILGEPVDPNSVNGTFTNNSTFNQVFSDASAYKNYISTNKASFKTMVANHDGLITDMTYMFYECSALTSLDLSSFDTSNATNMGSMFEECRALTSLDLSSFDTTNVTSMRFMFYGCNALTSLDLSSFDTTNVTSMMFMFGACTVLTSLDLSSFDTTNVTNVSSMFNGCTALTTVYCRTQADANKLMGASSTPSTITFVVGKP